MLEPDVTLTDYALTVECAGFCAALVRRQGASPTRTAAVALFASLGAASLLGGTVHGFFPDPTTVAHAVLWRGTLLAIGLVALFAWAVGARLLWDQGKCRAAVLTLAGLDFLAYAAVVGWVSQTFLVAIVNYLPPITFLLAAFVVRYRRASEARWRHGIVGVLLTFAAALAQQLKLGLHPVYFNHNAVYHVVQAVALAFLFLALA